MNDKANKLYAMIEDQKLTLEGELKEQIEVKEAAEKRIAEIRAEIAELPVRPPKQRKAAKPKAKRVKAPKDPRSVFEVARDGEKPEEPTNGE